MTGDSTKSRTIGDFAVVDREAPLDADTIAFDVVGDLRLSLVLGSGLLLQVMHPIVGAGVAQHSVYKENPWKRLSTSLFPILGAVYDGHDAKELGERIRAAHENIKGVDNQGRKYHAMDPDAYAWVHATIFESVVTMQRLFRQPLSADEESRFYHEWRYVGMTYGLRPRDMPADLQAFKAYYEDVLANRLEDSDTAHDVIEVMNKIPAPTAWPFGSTAWMLTAMPISYVHQTIAFGTLPPSARELLGIEWTKADQAKFDLYAAIVRTGWKIVPRRFSYFPRAAKGFRREEARLQVAA
jgi:uncharacterized protein (DUF2236 family)